MNEQQLEALERYFPAGGMIVMKLPNGCYEVSSFSAKDNDTCPAMDDLVEATTDVMAPILNRHFPVKKKGDA